MEILALGWTNLRLTDGRTPEYYAAVLDCLSPEELINAFALGAGEEWFPSPGRLIALSGHADALEAEALHAILTLAEVLRGWPMLKAKAGRLLGEGRDGEGGRYLPEAERQYESPVEPPALADAVIRTIAAMGDGDAVAGLTRITPAVPGILGLLNEDQSYELRLAMSVKRNWVDNYRRVVNGR